MSSRADGTPFFRLSGAGNDFIALVAPPDGSDLPPPATIRAWCSRGLSLGADGVFTLRPLAPGRVAMAYANADGEPAALCINGARCAARLALELGWGEGDAVAVETGAGTLAARRAGPTEITLALPRPDAAPEPREPVVDGRSHPGWLLTLGVQHFVLESPGDLAAAPVATLGPRLRAHGEWGAEGANVDFVRFAGSGRLAIRTYERGVEAETLACGTGVLAAVAVGLAVGRLALPVTATTRGGFDLTVAGEETSGASRRWSLTGDARIVAEGRLRPEATSLPERA